MAASAPSILEHTGPGDIAIHFVALSRIVFVDVTHQLSPTEARCSWKPLRKFVLGVEKGDLIEWRLRLNIRSV